jgi:hypothetical protein
MISWVAMDRIVERKRAEDSAYRSQGGVHLEPAHHFKCTLDPILPGVSRNVSQAVGFETSREPRKKDVGRSQNPSGLHHPRPASDSAFA